MENQHIVISSNDLERVSNILVKQGKYNSYVLGPKGEFIIWTDMEMIKEIHLLPEEKSMIDSFLDCPICHTKCSTLITDYRGIDNCVSKIKICYDCRLENNDTYLKIKELSKKDKFSYLKDVLSTQKKK